MRECAKCKVIKDWYYFRSNLGRECLKCETNKRIENSTKHESEEELRLEDINLEKPVTVLGRYQEFSKNVDDVNKLLKYLSKPHKILKGNKLYLLEFIKPDKSVAGKYYILERDNYTCVHCSNKTNRVSKTILEDFTDEYTNFAATCDRCSNFIKGSKNTGEKLLQELRKYNQEQLKKEKSKEEYRKTEEYRRRVAGRRKKKEFITLADREEEKKEVNDMLRDVLKKKEKWE